MSTKYTVTVTVELIADTEREALGYIEHTIEASKQTEIIYCDAEVIDSVQMCQQCAEDEAEIGQDVCSRCDALQAFEAERGR